MQTATKTTDFINYLKRVCAKSIWHDEQNSRTKYTKDGTLYLELKKSQDNFLYQISFTQPQEFNPLITAPISKLHILQVPRQVSAYGVELLVDGFLDNDIGKEFIVNETKTNIIIPVVQRIDSTKFMYRFQKTPIHLDGSGVEELTTKVYHNMLNKPYFI